MELAELQKLGDIIDQAYIKSGKERGYGERTPLVYTGFLMTDIGELVEQIMAKEKYRDGEDIDKKIEHELADCLWAILMLAKHLNVDMEKAYTQMIKDVQGRQQKGTAG
jgi:NTP pyrophosphatase (non-canonical NTP hydrolase)